MRSFPLSPLQLGMLYESGAGSGGGYLQQLVVRDRCGAFDAGRVRAGWQRLAAQVQALRAEVVSDGSAGPSMAFQDAVEPIIEEPGCPAGGLEAFLEGDRNRGLPRFPLWRVSLLEVDGAGVIVWTFHHILLDGRSHVRVFEAFWRVYDGGEAAPLEGNAFEAFLEFLSRRDGRADKEYFCGRLGGVRAHPRVTSGASFEPAPPPAKVVVGAAERAMMEAAAERLGVTLHTLVQGAWGLVLCRHGETSQAVFGSVRAGRHWDGVGHPDAIGCFVATVPFVVELREEERVSEWLGSLRSQQEALRAHEQASLADIRRWCGMPGPVFQTIVMFDRAPLREHFEALDAQWKSRTIELRERLSDVALTVQAGDEIEVEIGDPEEAYAPLEIGVLLRHFCAALRAIAAAGPDALVGGLSLMSPGEEEALGQWARTEQELPAWRLHEWIDRLAAGQPGAKALEAGGLCLSYADLSQQTRLVAWWLGERYHLSAGGRVLVFLDREPAMPVVMLALFRLGAVYVPLDPSTPAARVSQCLRDSGAILAITTAEHRAALPEPGVPVLDFHALLGEAEGAAEGRPPPEPDSASTADEAVILYTSGSTGTPKGALLDHRGLSNFSGALQKVFRLPPTSRVAQISSPSFDASLLDMILAFSSGGALVFGTWSELQAGRPLADFLRRKAITAAFFTPTLLRTLPSGELPELGTLFCGGEVCPSGLAEAWAEGRAFFNLYGPTEATVFTLYERVRTPLNGHPALGVNLPNTSTEIWDAAGRLCPIGVPGEICIGGIAVGPGYINLAGRTARSFVTNPQEPGGRVYRTGDKGVRLPDGRVDFIERMDRQVKVRGVRVELGEIEAGLTRCAGVREAAVLLQGDELVGFVAPPVAEDALRRELAGHLSFFLVPGRIEMRDALPKTVSGKLDRRALEGGQGPPEADLLPEADRHRVLVEWNPAADEAFPAVHEQMSGWAARHPEACAVGWEGGSMTYAELEHRSNQVANLLCGETSPVVVFVEAGAQSPALLAGALKAGRPYVPLDPLMPDERIAYIISQSGAGAVISQPSLAGRLPGQRVILADAGWKFLEGVPSAATGRKAAPGDLAYIIYTSGSTGRPKGVEVEHHSLANLCAHYRRRLELGPGDRSSLLASISFDASIADLWPCLACGASVHIPPPGTKSDLAVLAGWLVRAGITRCFAPTALGELLFDVSWPEATPLKDLLVGGDRLTRHPGALPFRVINTYGPTECTVDAVWFEVPQTGDQVPPPIGRPITNYSAYIVDGALRPVAVGVPGELLLGGAGVTRGYRNQPELTAERFLSNPFGPGRVYRTGDSVRYRPDGVIEFIGRTDNQVQIHGFRVELGEIEAAVRGCPGVREVHVRMGGSPRKPALVVYYSGGPTVSAEDLRQQISRGLPAYMVPHAFVRMDALPRNPAGKVDKDRLPEPERGAIEGDGEPNGETEQQLHGIASELLGTGSVSMSANFFDEGGDSVALLSLLLRVEKAFGVSVSAMSFLQDPCLRSLARRIESQAPVRRGCLLPIKPEGTKPPLFCICPASWFRPVARHIDPERPMFALEVLLLDAEIVENPEIGEIARAFVEAVREVQPCGPYHLAGYSSNGMAVVEMARILRGEGEELAPVLLFDVFAPSLLRTGPLASLAWKAIHFFSSPGPRLRGLVQRLAGVGKVAAPCEVAGEVKAFGAFARRLHIASLAYEPAPVDADFLVIKSSLIPDIFPNRRDLGWKGLCRSLTAHELPGDHRSFLENGIALAKIIDEGLEGTGGHRGAGAGQVALRVVEVRAVDGLDPHAKAWDALLLRCPGTSPVLSHAWMRAYFSHKIPAGARWACLFAYRGSELIAVLPLIEGGRRGVPGLQVQRWHPPHNVFHTTRVDMLAAPGDERAMDGFLRFLRTARRAWPILSFRGLPAGSPSLAYAQGLPRKARLRPCGGENVITLTAGYEEYRRGLDGKFLRELRRRARKLDAMGKVEFRLRETTRTVEENLRRFLQVEDSGWKGKGDSSILRIPGEEAFFLEATKGLAEHGWLEWNFLELDGRTISGHLALRSGRTLFVLKIGYEKEFASYAPGNLLLEKVIEHSCGCGDVDEINFLAECDWHGDWAVRSQPLREVTIFPFRRLGWKAPSAE